MIVSLFLFYDFKVIPKNSSSNAGGTHDIKGILEVQ